MGPNEEWCMDSRDDGRPAAPPVCRHRDVGALVIMVNSMVAGVSGVFIATRSVAVTLIAAAACVAMVSLLLPRR
jgi:hypothetical protein